MKRSMTPLHSGCVDKNREPTRIRPEAVRASEGGRPAVCFHLNPRLRVDGPPRARPSRPRGAPKP
jgi:hypothetical protein